MARISFNAPCYYFTSVTHHRLPVFRTDKFKQLLCDALNDARKSSGMLIFAYVVMLDHLHIITDGKRSPSETLRYINGVSARRIIDYLKTGGHKSSLRKLQQAQKADGWKYSLWEHHSDKFLLTGESLFMQKVKYIHENPVKEGLVEQAEDYLFSSSRIWSGKPLEAEPLSMDIDQLDWYRR